ncbi:MAG: MBOAT family O-acyltransferase [Aquabacterium commune]|uniref:MBOAT family O-acyltransferase n=1 Tax=Aquabacterium commune TaxID=70586 RepID=UPI003BB10684
MLFNSYAFLFLFLPITLFGFFSLSRIGWSVAAVWLALSSLLFYGFWDARYVTLLLGSITCNFGFGWWLSQAHASGQMSVKRRVLQLAIGVNLMLLAYFKYANFFIDNLNALAGLNWTMAAIVLPMGISFFTFTQIAFLVDAHEGKVREHNFVHYVLFVTFFPHLIAGPVLHHKDMMPQFATPSTYRIQWGNVATGLLLLILGLCKKTLLADAFAPYATALFDAAGQGDVPLTTYEAWAGALAYTFQIYFDFSGYTDMALGIALMFNVRLPTNFNSPYKATSIIEFWRRWHITLSTFLRDYLYIPLGGNRHGTMRRHVNLLTTMLLGGLWHGAGWTFVVWGGLHGLYLIVNHLWQASTRRGWVVWPSGWAGRMLGGAITFVAVVTAWVFFRADSVPQAVTLLKAMYGIDARPIAFELVTHGHLIEVVAMSSQALARLLLLGGLWVWLLPNASRVAFSDRGLAVTLLQVLGACALLHVVIDRFGHYSPFLYFQF